MDDDGVGLVALNHADIEEPGIFAVHDVVERSAAAVAVILRRLDKAHLGVGEMRDEIGQPVGCDRVIGVDDADDLGIRCGVRERKPQGAGLVSLEFLRIDEFEALAERPAMLLDRLPHRRVRRVVDDEDAFEIRIGEPGDRVRGSP